jgi:hypothetical protein
MSTNNSFNVVCDGCGAPYYEQQIGRFRHLFHKGTEPGESDPVMPTAKCRYSWDFVLFTPCEHCCPESFADCPKCTFGNIGKPTAQRCGYSGPPKDPIKKQPFIGRGLNLKSQA